MTRFPPLSDTLYRRLLLVLGHFFFLSYLAGCVLFYKERLLNFDSAYYSFHLIITGDFFIKHDRWISYLTQWLPLWVMRSGGSLQMVLVSYSAAFALWFYIIYLLIVYGFRHAAGGVFYALAMGLCIRYKYYAAISEITFSLALAALLIAWLTSRYRPKPGEQHYPFWGVALIITLFMYGSHPVIILPLLGFFAMDMAHYRRWKDTAYWLFIGFLLLLYAYTFWELSGNAYEQKRMGIIAQITAVWQNPSEFAVYHIIKRYLQVEYTLPLLLTAVLVGVWFWQKRFVPAVLFIGLNLAWLAINVGTYAYLRNHMYIMIDGYLALFGLIWAIPFLLLLLRSPYRRIALLVCSILLLFSMHRIYGKHEFYSQRHAYLLKTIELNLRPGQRKMILPLDRFDWDKLWYPYEVPHETLMLTALQHRDSTATIFVNYDQIPLDQLKGDDKDDFLHFDHNYSVDKLPPMYFNLPEGNYRLIDKVAW